MSKRIRRLFEGAPAPRIVIVGAGFSGIALGVNGLTVPDFPNFFMMYGPGTNGGELISMFERQAEHVVRVATRMMRDGVTAVEVKRGWYERYNRWLQSKMQGTSWLLTRNYFTSPTGKVVTQWPFGAIFYGLLVKAVAPLSETNSTRRIAG